MELSLPHNWTPRDYQLPLWKKLETGCKRAAAVWHRRAGKDDVMLHWIATASQRRVGNYWTMLPLQSQARRAIWQSINPHTGVRRIDEAFPPDMRANTRDNDMSITFANGSQWQVLGSDSYDSHVGAAPIGIVWSEWALSDPRSWAYLRPILLENNGWALFNFTPRGSNHAKRTFETWQSDSNWYCERLTANDTNVFTEEQLKAEKREYVGLHGADEGEALFNQEYHCSFDSPVLGGEIHIIDYIEDQGKALPYYVDLLNQKKSEFNYNYTQHILPHDAKARELQTGKTRQEALKYLGIEATIISQHNVDDGIHAVRMMLPRCWFDSVRCERGIDCLRSYRKAEDQHKSDGVHKFYQSRPLHDFASHAADAFRYGAMARSKVSGNRARGPIEYPSMQQMGMI
jgi:phage terminase large subunit